MLSLFRAWELNMGQRFQGLFPTFLSGIAPSHSSWLRMFASEGRVTVPRVRALKCRIDSMRMISAPRSASSAAA